MVKRTEKQDGIREQPRRKSPRPSGPAGKTTGNKRRPRGALFHGDDPTLARRVEEELHNLGR